MVANRRWEEERLECVGADGRVKSIKKKKGSRISTVEFNLMDENKTSSIKIKRATPHLNFLQIIKMSMPNHQY